MPTTEHLEIYKQRYETFRHLDRLRWQMLQIGVGVCSLGVLAFARTFPEADWWIFAAVGPVLAILGVAMLRIGHGVNRNNQVLRKTAEEVGDLDIPSGSKCCKSVSFWISLTLVVVGLFCIVLAALRYEWPCTMN